MDTTGREDELRAAGRVGGQAAGWLAGAIGDVHAAVAGRAFGPAGPAAGPARAVHDAISREVYAAVRTGLDAGLRAAGAVAAAGSRPGAPALADGPRGAQALAVLNAYAGDRLERGGSALALGMTIRAGGRAVPVTRAGLAAAFPGATDHLVVFVHGLGETERSWRLGARRWHGDPRSTHGTRLRADLQATPVVLRVNTGLPVLENGRRLTALLDALVAAWPVPVHVVDLVGHSMGGLIARAAAADLTAPWTVLLRHVACLGSPHGGAPLEQGAAIAARALARVPELRGVAEAFEVRSAGIKDLHDGLGADLPFPRHARCHALSATLHADPRHPVSHLLGDLLVRHGSAQGTGLAFERRGHAPALDHFALLNHPLAYAWLRATLGHPAQLPART
jgi:pimeloyl-ACP methyl ester carboxylesterase